MVLVYAFSNQWGTNTSRRVISELQKYLPPRIGFNYKVITGHPRSFFEKYIKNDKYRLIIGLWDFYGESSKIRIETVAKNVYGKESLSPLLPIKLELSLPEIDMYEPEFFEISEFMGTYNCNWIAFMIQSVIERKKLATKNLFLHLPKKAKSEIIAKKIFNLIEANEMLK